MINIIIYLCIIVLGAFLTRKNVFPKLLLKRIGLLQSLSLYILLGAMGLKIGSDKNLMSNLHILGLRSFVVTIFAILFTIIFVKLFYGSDRR